MKHYRFQIDLRVLKRGRPAGPPRERVDISSEEEPEEERLYPLEETGDPQVRAYNASLSWACSQLPGRFVTGTLEYNVFKGPEQTFHVITRPRTSKSERVSEVVIFPDGHLLSRSLSLQEGEPQDLEELFKEGLEWLDQDDRALADLPGYELQATWYQREGSHLAGVERWQRYWDQVTDSLVHHQTRNNLCEPGRA
ncbi:hypothetical protein DYH09_19135 [bacterium CPR1]|nr:hypothetical protein [bacterium CPR1]